MIVQFNTSNDINGKEKLTAPFVQAITESLDHYSEHITRIEAHLSDENGRKEGGNDKRCTLEARIEGKQPIAVTSHADTYQQAVDEAIEKLKNSLESIMGKAADHRAAKL